MDFSPSPSDDISAPADHAELARDAMPAGDFRASKRFRAGRRGADHLAFLGEKDSRGEVRSYRLYSSWSVGVAAFFGSLAAGGLIMAVNYWRLRRWFAALAILVAGLAATAGLAVICVIFTTANDGVKLAGPLAGMGQFFVAGTMVAVADMLQGRALRRHELLQGKLASTASALAIALGMTGLTCLVVWHVLQKMHEPADLYAAGFVAARGGDLDKADVLFSRAIALRPDFGEAYLQRGMVRSQKHQYGPAVEDLDKAVALLAGQGRALVERGRNKLQLGQNEEAVADISQAVHQVPTAEAYYLRAIGQTQIGHFREATLDCSFALRLETRSEYFKLRAVCYDRLGEHRRADFDRKCAENMP